MLQAFESLVVQLPGTTKTCAEQPKVMLQLSGGQQQSQAKVAILACTFY